MGLINMYGIIQLKLRSLFKLARGHDLLSPLELCPCFDNNNIMNAVLKVKCIYVRSLLFLVMKIIYCDSLL